MLYVEYNDYRDKYYKAQKVVDGIVDEKVELFIKTQPKATDYGKETVSGGTVGNAFDNYLIAKDNKQIDKRLEEARSILEDRENLLKLKEEELRNSKDWYDIIYVYYYIEKLSIRKIEKRIPFSLAEIYRKIKTIRNNIKLEQNENKVVVK